VFKEPQKIRRGAPTLSREEAEEIAIGALAYIAGDVELTRRFLGLSGLEAGDLRRAAGDPAFLAGVLEFVMGHEPVLIAIAAAANRPVADVETAHRHMVRRAGGGGDPA
jgi:hypothetical protein